MFTVTRGHVIWLTEQRQLTVKEVGFRKNTEFCYNTEFHIYGIPHYGIPYIRNSVINTEFRNLIPAELREKIPQNSGGIPYHGIPLNTLLVTP